MNKLFLLLVIGLFVVSGYTYSKPDEGMWVPMFLKNQNFLEMKKMGLKLTADELYDINNSSLKDAIVGFGSVNRPFGFGCTAEIISDNGLMLTNHHCGYGYVHKHSTMDHDYLKDGFWAMKKEDELPNEGLSISFLVRMEDVSSKYAEKLSFEMPDSLRKATISSISEEIEKEASEDGKYQAKVKPFFEGNDFYLLVYQMYMDVRLVGAPPSSIGKFGGDTDNWMWPRHTGDFCLFRIYTAPDGSPAPYSKENIPLKPKHYLPISLKGVKENDFTMIWGFPGSTDRYLSSYGVRYAIDKKNPTIVKIRDKKLSILKSDMDMNEEIKLKYSAKYAGSSNYWKYYIGQTKGVKRLKVYDIKKKTENDFTQWLKTDVDNNKIYDKALPSIENGYKQLNEMVSPLLYIKESVMMGPELITFSNKISKIKKVLLKDGIDSDAYKEAIPHYKVTINEHFNTYDVDTDKKLFVGLMELYYKEVEPKYHPDFFEVIMKKYKGDFEEYADYLYEKSIFSNKDKLMKFLENPKSKKISSDPAYQIYLSFVGKYRHLYYENADIQKEIKHGCMVFAAGIREMNKEKKYYPNANSTMRYTYGKVLDYFPVDAVHYNYFTTLKGIMEKEDPSKSEFIVFDKLKTLYKNKDYGRYGNNGIMNTCFISNNDITGGNSGSPIINGEGHLIGVAFDGNWEAMSSDIAFEHNLQRCINVDIRYVLFVIDKFAGAKHLIDEMTIIE